MPKKAPKGIPTELLIPGQPSAETMAQLRRVGETLTDETIANVVILTDTTRASYQVAAIELGLLLLAKRETLKHGQWQNYLASIWDISNRKRASDLHNTNVDNFTKSLRVYCHIAQHFVADLEQGNFQPDGLNARVTPPAIRIEDALTLQLAKEGQRQAVEAAIGKFVGGRSLRRMLIDFRRAESASDREELEEEAARRRKKKDKGEQPGQLDFWDDLKRPIDEIDRLMEDTAVRETVNAEYWLQLAKALEDQAKRARKLAAETNG